MKQLTLIASAVTIASALMTGSAFAEDSTAEGSMELPKAVADLGIPGAHVDKKFDTGLDGINGWVISVENDTNVIYTTEDGKHAFVGMILGEGGENLTQAHMEEHMENSPLAGMPGRAGASQADNGYTDDEEAKALELVQSAPFYVEEGSGEQVIYVIFDTQCGYCQRMYQASRSVLDDVTIRWVPVGYLGEQSLRQAAQIADSDTPADTMALFEQGGGVTAAPSTEAMDLVSQNSQLAQQAGITATPTTIYEDANGEAQIRRGALRAAEIRNL
ncbi:Thiol:disulfide interchange protein DsbG precursor (plasmid) [Halomonas sp. THAF12]|uniref:thioredoxin fold domain-containing protein n=1 Tax=Halomonas sp. THAF12 TaxID=2587849 RepID=UPI0012681456|nr:thioredoxin fold domain-containing protein [Halomonas sp. THAF12]QFT86841.1 Thiol:disulfide interchange protein DsbG precursor [Halomonas sp. THAF12]